MDLLGPSPPDELSPTQMQPTPTTIRDRQGSFPRIDRGYAPEAVDAFLRTTADCLEGVAEKNRDLTSHANELANEVSLHEGRAWAVQEAMVAAQAMRAATHEEANQEADRIRALAAQEADALLTASRTERDRILSEVEDLSRSATAIRTEIEGPLAERRRRAVAEADRILQEAQAEATAQAMRIRDHAKAEVEVLRREALEEDARSRAAAIGVADGLRKQAETDAAKLRTEAEQAVKQMEDESLVHLERRSLQLIAQIAERHAALERLEEQRLEFLDRLGAVLGRQIKIVDRERSRSPLGPDEAADVGSDILIVNGGATDPAAARAPDDAIAQRGIIMPDNSVVILPHPGERRIGPTPITDGPSPLDPGADPPDDEPPLAAGPMVIDLERPRVEDDEREPRGGGPAR